MEKTTSTLFQLHFLSYYWYWTYLHFFIGNHVFCELPFHIFCLYFTELFIFLSFVYRNYLYRYFPFFFCICYMYFPQFFSSFLAFVWCSFFFILCSQTYQYFLSIFCAMLERSLPIQYYFLKILHFLMCLSFSILIFNLSEIILVWYEVIIFY